MYVEGHSGIGKTTLLEAACARLRALGVRVLPACGQELEQDFGFGVARQLFERALADASPEERARLLDGPAGLAGAAADALAAANLLGDGRPLRFVHPIVREAVYRELPAGARGRLHATAATAPIEHGQPPTRAAPHLLLAEPAGDPWVVELLRRAAAVAVGQGALDLAQRLLERALAEPPAADERSDVLAELGFAEAATGRRLERASAHLDEAAAATADAAERAARVEVAARARLYMADFDGAAERLRRARGETGAPGDPIPLRLLAHEAGIGLLAPPSARAAVAELEQHTEVRGEDPAELALLAELAGKRWLEGGIAEAVTFAQRALAGERLLAAEGPASVAFNHAVAVLIDGDRFDAADPPLERGLAVAREHGSLLALSSPMGLQAVAAWRRGDLPD